MFWDLYCYFQQYRCMYLRSVRICWIMHVLKIRMGCCHRHVLSHNQCVASVHHFCLFGVIPESRRTRIDVQPIGVFFWCFTWFSGSFHCSNLVGKKRNLITEEKLHRSKVGLKPRFLQIA